MTDAEKESEARCKAMLHKLISMVKEQTMEMEALAVRLKATAQLLGPPVHALPLPVPAPMATLVTAVDHAVAAAAPRAEAVLAPESPTKCSTSGPDTNAGDLQVVVESDPETGVPTVAEHSSAPSPKLFSTTKQDTVTPTRCSTACRSCNTDVPSACWVQMQPWPPPVLKPQRSTISEDATDIEHSKIAIDHTEEIVEEDIRCAAMENTILSARALTSSGSPNTFLKFKEENLKQFRMEMCASSSDNGTGETAEDASNDEGTFDNRSKNVPEGPSTKENISESAFVKQREAARLNMEPEVGMVFHSEDQAYLFYNYYAQRKGFSVRKGHLGRRKDGSVRNRVFLCSKEGVRQIHRTHVTKGKRETARTNCMARIEFKVGRDGVWLVSKVIYEHNHLLVRPHKAHLLRSHRKSTVAQQDETGEDSNEPAEATDLPLEAAREAESVGFLLKDRSSYLHTTRMRELEKGDAQFLLEYLKAKQLEDPSFFYAVQLDDREQVTNFFWADARSIIDYYYFGDVVLFDTTYRSNKSEMPFAPFVGINHHRQIVVFGVALLLDETTESFVWLFKTFMVAMSNRQPMTIFTDNCPALSRAISMALPQCCHRLCLWHILQNVSAHVSHIYNSEPNFQKDFIHCIYECGTEEDLNAGWISMINKYNLGSNTWLQDIYAVRDKWASCYQQSPFSATMDTLQWTENMRSHFKKLFNRKLPLSKFIDQYYKTLIRFREKELYEDHKSRQSKPILLVDVPMLNEAAESYTRLVYSEFEGEFKSQLSCLSEPVAANGTLYSFNVSPPDKQCLGIVEFDTSSNLVTCSCRKFEALGILCMHALKVLNNNNILHLPPRYILKRWTKHANVGVIPDKNRSIAEREDQDALTSQCSRVWRKAISIAVKSAFSEDALQMFETELEKLTIDIEQILRTSPFSKQTDVEDVSVVNDVQQTVLEGGRKKRGRKPKGGAEKKRRDTQLFTSQNHSIIPHHIPQDIGNTRLCGYADHMMLNDSSHIASYPRNEAPPYCNHIPLQPSEYPFAPEAIMATQEHLFTSQGIFDHGIAPQTSSNSNMARCTPGGSGGFTMPVISSQPQNFVNWMAQPHAVPNVHVPNSNMDEHMHPTISTGHQPLPHERNFDINKGD